MKLNLNQRITLRGVLAKRGVVISPAIIEAKTFIHYLSITHGYKPLSYFLS